MSDITHRSGSALISLLLVDGFDLLTAKVAGCGYKRSSVMEPTTGCGDNMDEASPTGTKKMQISIGEAFFDTRANGLHAALKTGDADMTTTYPPTAKTEIDRILCACMEGNAVGKSFFGASGVYTHTYEALGKVSNLTKANVGIQVNGNVDEGVILLPHANRTADYLTKTGAAFNSSTSPSASTSPSTSVSPSASSSSSKSPSASVSPSASASVSPSASTSVSPSASTSSSASKSPSTSVSPSASKSPSTSPSASKSPSISTSPSESYSASSSIPTNSVDNGASSASGGVGYFQLSALAGFARANVRILQSSDDVTYTPLVSFVAMTAIGAQRIEVSGTVQRYLAAEVDVDGGIGDGNDVAKTFAGFARY